MNDDARLTQAHRDAIATHLPTGLGVSAISCWEVAMLATHNRIALTIPPLQWVDSALTHPDVVLLQLTPQIAVESVILPDWDHRDPADRMIVATARAHDCPIVTEDARIRTYLHVRLA